MDFKIIQKEGFKVQGIPVELSNSQTSNYYIITNHWREFNKAIRTNNIVLHSNWEKFGISFQQNGKYYYMPTISFETSILNFKSIDIEAGMHAIFQHKGDMKFLKSTIHKIYKELIPNNKLQLNLERYILHFEHYNYNFNWNKSNSTIDIYVPLINE